MKLLFKNIFYKNLFQTILYLHTHFEKDAQKENLKVT
jgi:hypothetical protein